MTERRLLENGIVVILVAALCLVVARLIWKSGDRRRTLIESAALQQAKARTNSLEIFRTLYSSEVVARVRDRSVEVSHDYVDKEGAIPLPATLSMLLGNRIGEASGTRVNLYSDYPFPWRIADRKLDAFQVESIRHLRRRPDSPFYRIETSDGKRVLRYASADVMRPSCVSCHNSHPETPKSDWKTGDLRGVLEVAVPLEAAVEHAGQVTDLPPLDISMIGALGLVIIMLQIRRWRRSARELEHRVADRTSELRCSEGRFRSILESALDCVIAIDHTGRIVEFNPAAEETFGSQRAEVLGRALADVIIPSNLREQHRESLRRLLSPGVGSVLGSRIEITAIRADGSEFPVELAISASATSEGSEPFFTAFLRDISERKRANEVILQAKDAAEQANLAKSEFLANMSHELRTPLHGIISYAGLGTTRCAKVQREKLEEYFEIIGRSGQTLLHLLNDVLDLAKLESGSTTFDLREIELADVVQTVALEYDASLTELDLRLDWRRPGFDTRVHADRTKISQVMRNILNNAIKFSPVGGLIEVEMTDGEETIMVSVRDQGPGIPQPELRSVFDKFVQSTMTNDGAGGTGLGLSICKEIMTAHGGRIWAENNPDSGTSFYFVCRRSSAATTERRRLDPEAMGV